MILEGIRVERAAAGESSETARELCAPPFEIIRSQLIDREEHDQRGNTRRVGERTRRALRRATLCGEWARAQESEGGDVKSSDAIHVTKLARAMAHVTSM